MRPNTSYADMENFWVCHGLKATIPVVLTAAHNFVSVAYRNEREMRRIFGSYSTPFHSIEIVVKPVLGTGDTMKRRSRKSGLVGNR